jgi:hypothetical protein
MYSTNVVFKYVCYLYLVQAFIFGPCSFAWAAKSLSPEAALDVIKSLEKRIRNASWNVEISAGTLSDPKDYSSFVREPGLQSSKGKVIFENIRGRYRYDSEVVTAWIQGKAAFGAAIESFAFNGTAAQKFDRSAPGDKLPKNDSPALGTVKEGNFAEFMKECGPESGIGYFPPFFYNIRFSEYVRRAIAEKTLVSIQEDDNGVWLITLRDQEYTGKVIMEYHPLKGGVFSSVQWIGGSGGTVWRKVDYDLYKLNEDVWLPKACHMVFPLDRKESRLEFTDVHVNFSVEESVFQIDFPVGTRVTNYIEQKTYTVGSGIEDDQAKVRAFMLENGLYVPEEQLITWKTIVFSIAAGVLVIAFGFLLFLRRKKIQGKRGHSEFLVD